LHIPSSKNCDGEWVIVGFNASCLYDRRSIAAANGSVSSRAGPDGDDARARRRRRCGGTVAIANLFAGPFFLSSVGPMNPSHFSRLSDEQKACLRLVFANLSIKEIGRELNESPNTIKSRLTSARRLLEVDTSMHAAAILVRHERDTLGVDPPRCLALERQLTDEDDATTPEGPVLAVRNRYSFGYLSRIALIVAIAFGSVEFAGALLVGSEAIKQIFQTERIDISDYPYRQ
jgi:DNA-binding CsgD family transcriptional regulator